MDISHLVAKGIDVGRNFAGGDLAHYGGGSFLGAVECAGFDFGNFFDSGGCAADAPFDYLGGLGGMHLGGGEYFDDFCDSGCGVEHCVSFVEFKQSFGDFVGIYFFQ